MFLNNDHQRCGEFEISVAANTAHSRRRNNSFVNPQTHGAQPHILFPPQTFDSLFSLLTGIPERPEKYSALGEDTMKRKP